VINDQINVNFETSDPDKKYLAQEMRSRFSHLMSAHASLEHTQPTVRGEDAEHVKRHHGVKEETQVMHMHYSFDQDVTPQLLEHFFNQLLTAQKSPDHPGDQFIMEHEVKEIIKAFTTFYAEFKGSKLENEFLEERQLTKQEKDSLVKHAKQEMTSHLSKRDVSELERCGFTSSEIPKPSQQPAQDSHASSFSISDLELLLALMAQNRSSGFTPGFFQNPAKFGSKAQTSDPIFSFSFQ
jgi:hypothetical protein